MNSLSQSEYQYASAEASHTQGYLWQPIIDSISKQFPQNSRESVRVLEVGCGNGAFAGRLCELGFQVSGIDPSISGVDVATRAWPKIPFRVASAYDDLLEQFGAVDIVTSLEVVEHLYSPREFATRIFEVLKPGGIAIVSTPFHGYWKNLMLALTGKLDAHFTPLWDHGHIKFWSVKSLSTLLTEAGFVSLEFKFAGRAYPFSKSMIAICVKPK